jgi:hypothetical protein
MNENRTQISGIHADFFFLCASALDYFIRGKSHDHHLSPLPTYHRLPARQRLLITHHQTGNLDGNWLEPAWEYMHFHPAIQPEHLSQNGIWEEDGQIVAVVHYEWRLGEAFFQFHPAYRHLRAELLDYAETNLRGLSAQNNQPYLRAYVNDNDQPFLELVQARGYQKNSDATRPLYRFDIPNPFPAIPLADGFRLTSLAEECDWAKVHQVMWRGFGHGDDVPMTEEEFDDRRKMFDTPKARRDLKIAVAAPNGEFAAFCGMFYDETGQFAYVEPVATDPATAAWGWAAPPC